MSGPAERPASAASPGDGAPGDFRKLVARLMGYSFSYGMFGLVAKVGGFFLFPVYWRFMTPEDFGLVGLAAVAQALIGSLMTLGLESGLSRFYHSWASEERAARLGKLWLVSTAYGLAVALLATLLGIWISPIALESMPYSPYFPIAVWTAFFQSLSAFPFMLLRITERIRLFGVASLISFFAGALLSIALVAWFRMGALGFLLAGLLNSAGLGIFWSAWILRRARPAFSLAGLREEVRFSLPSLPLNIVVQLDAALDRLFLDKLAALEQIGIYSLARKFGEYFNQVNQSLKSAWMPMLYKMVDTRADFRALLPRLSLFYFHVLAAAALAAALLSQEFIEAFGRERYLGVYPYAAAFVLGFLLLACGTALGRGMDLAKRPKYEMAPLFAGIAVNLPLLALLIPRHGLAGAAAAFVASCGTRTAVQVALAHWFYRRRFPAGSLLLLTSLAAAAAWAGFRLATPHLLPDIPVKLGLVSAYGILGGLYLARRAPRH